MKQAILCKGSLAALGFLSLFGGEFQAIGQKTSPGSPAAAQRAEGRSPFVHERTELVNLTITVTDRNGRAVHGLKAGDLGVYEDKVKQKIEFYGVEDAPISVGVVFDISGSMRNKLVFARAALKAFIETSHQDDDFFLVGFNNRARLVSDFCNGGELERRLSVVTAQGDTALYDAVYLGIEKVQQGRHRNQSKNILKPNLSHWRLHEESANFMEHHQDVDRNQSDLKHTFLTGLFRKLKVTAQPWKRPRERTGRESTE